LLQGLFYDQPVRLLGLLNIAQLSNDTLGELFQSLHGASATVFKILIAIHVLAALKHQFIGDEQARQRIDSLPSIVHRPLADAVGPPNIS